MTVIVRTSEGFELVPPAWATDRPATSTAAVRSWAELADLCEAQAAWCGMVLETRQIEQHARDMVRMERAHMVEAVAAYKDRKSAIYDASKQAGARIRAEIIDSHKPAWRDLYRQQFQEGRAFEKREQRLWGKITNTLEAITYRRDIDPETSRGWLSSALNFVTSRTARADALKQLHEKQKDDLRREQKRMIDRATKEIRQKRTSSLSRALSTFGSERTALIDRQADDKAAMKMRWREDSTTRKRGFATVVQDASYRRAAKADLATDQTGQARERQGQFRDAAEGNARRIGRSRKRTRKRDDSK